MIHKGIKTIIDMLDEVREVAYSNLSRVEIKDDDRSYFYWHRLNGKQADYLESMLQDRIIELKRDQEKNLDEIYFADDIQQTIKNIGE